MDPGAEAGYWTLDFVLVRDKQLNTRKYTAAEIQLLTPGDTPKYQPILAGEHVKSRFDAAFAYRRNAV